MCARARARARVCVCVGARAMIQQKIRAPTPYVSHRALYLDMKLI